VVEGAGVKLWAYYNDNDPNKCAWVRELIKSGVVTDGEVDERPIQSVRPKDLKGFKRAHFFCGIAIWDYALNLAGWGDREVWTGSCPCQPFSGAGKGEAFNDERHLWPEFFRLIEARRPIVCFGEQVASIDGLAWLDLVQSDLDDAGYTCGAVDLCAAGLGAPHRRQRIYWVADTPEARRTGARKHDGGLSPLPARLEQCGDNGHVADSEHSQRWPEQQEYREARGRHRSGRRGDSLRVADSQSGGCGVERDAGERSEAERLADPYLQSGDIHGRERAGIPSAAGRSAIGQLADTDGSDASAEREQRSGKLGQQPEDGRDVPVARGPVNGFWRDADWVLTRPQRVGDCPGLRPIERQSQSMVDGPSGDLGPSGQGGFPLAQKTEARVSRLRGYGDGIVAPVAAAFIQSYMEIRDLGFKV